MTTTIHPTACIADNVKLGDGVIIGPYAVIEPDVVLGDGCEISLLPTSSKLFDAKKLAKIIKSLP